MTRSYFTEDAKMRMSPWPKWDIDECLLIEDILQKKGYRAGCVSRVACDRKFHDAWQVERKDVPRLIEQLFRQRLVVEVQADGKGKASIIFAYDYKASDIIGAVKRFWKNKPENDNMGFGVLSDYDIGERVDELFDNPIDAEDIQPASVDLHLASELVNLDGETFNLTQEDYILQPNEFILGSTSEYVTIPNDLVAQVDGKSSIGRLGIDIHKTAGWIDPAFNGNITLEIKNDSDKPFRLVDGMNICQIIFLSLTSPCARGYGDSSRNNHYQNSEGTIQSRYEY